MANKASFPSNSFTPLKSDGTTIVGNTTGATDFNTDAYSLHGAEFFGVNLKVSSPTGTSPTLDLEAEVSFDGGTDWVAYPGVENSGTQAALTQLTSSVLHKFEYWRNVLNLVGANEGKIRFKFNLGGTNPGFTVDEFDVVYVKNN